MQIDTSVRTEGSASTHVAVPCRARGDGARLYHEADAAGRRQLNQAVFEWIRIDIDGTTETRLTPPFAVLLEDKRLERALKNSVVLWSRFE